MDDRGTRRTTTDRDAPPRRGGPGSRPAGARGSPPRGKPGFRRAPGPPGPNAEEKLKATQLAGRSGIPFPQALMVVRGTLKLNDVLNELFARERRDRLVKEGLNASLAGQVARGHLPLDRARKIQSLWTTQQASFHSDALRALENASRAAVALFGRDPVVGSVGKVSRYDVTLLGDGPAEPLTVKKHEVKFHCRPEDLPRVLAALGTSPEVAALGLGASTSLDDRFRPTEDLALEWTHRQKAVRLVFRDGQTIAGVPVRVALFEIELDVGDGARVSVLTHSLFKDRPFEGP